MFTAQYISENDLGQNFAGNIKKNPISIVLEHYQFAIKSQNATWFEWLPGQAVLVRGGIER